MPTTTEHRMQVRSTDMDSDQIVNNARYLEYFEQARLEHLALLGIVRARHDGEKARSFTIAQNTCRYRAPLRHRENIVVRAWTEEVRNRSFVLAYEIVRDDDGVVVADGSSVQVWLDEAGRPAGFPPDVRAALEASAA